MRRAFAAVAVVAATFSLAFLVVPVVALFVHVPPGDLLHALGTPAARDALVVSAKTSAIAHGAVLLIGTPAAIKPSVAPQTLDMLELPLLSRMSEITRIV